MTHVPDLILEHDLEYLGGLGVVDGSKGRLPIRGKVQIGLLIGEAQSGEEALEMFEGLETRWQIGRTLSELAELALAQTDQAQARDYFSRALVAFEEMKAVPDAARTREALRLLD